MEKMPGYSPESVTAIYELYGKYHFNQKEIQLIGKDVSIISIITERIRRILEDEKNAPSYETIEKNLKENKEEVIAILEKYKEQVSKKYIINRFETEKITINETIDMIEKMEEIQNKYEGKFSKIKKYINGEPLVDIETYNNAIQNFKKNNECNT